MSCLNLLAFRQPDCLCYSAVLVDRKKREVEISNFTIAALSVVQCFSDAVIQTMSQKREDFLSRSIHETGMRVPMFDSKHVIVLDQHSGKEITIAS